MCSNVNSDGDNHGKGDESILTHYGSGNTAVFDLDQTGSQRTHVVLGYAIARLIYRKRQKFP